MFCNLAVADTDLPHMELFGGLSLVNVVFAKENVMFANAGVHYSPDPKFLVGLKYMRTLMMGLNLGAFSATNVEGSYMVIPGKVHVDNILSIGADYQLGGFNFGQMPMIGALVFTSGSLGLYDLWWEFLAAGLYSSMNSTYEIKDIWRAQTRVGKAIKDNMTAHVGVDSRNFVYQTAGTSGGYSSLSLLSLSLGLGLAY